MTINIRAAIDWDNDRFICKDSVLADALNLIPNALSLYTLDLTELNGATYERKSVETDYGINVWEVASGTNVTGGFAIGRTGTTIDDIPASPSTQYTAVLWIKGISSYAGVDLETEIKRNGNIVIDTSSTYQATSAWVKRTFTFTTDASTTHISIAVMKDNSATAAIFQITGYMLVAGATAPTGYNVGSISNRYDIVSGDLLSAQWQLGMKKDIVEYAHEGSATLLLDNTDKLYSPEYSSSVLYGFIKENLRVIIEVYDPVALVWKRMWTGWTASVEPDVGTGSGARQTTIGCTQGIFRISDVPARASVTAETTYDTLIRTILSGGWVSAGTPYYCEIGNSKIGVNAFISDLTDLATLGTGVNIYEYLGDDWKNNETSSWKVLTDLLRVEQGWLWLGRDGLMTFRNRDYYLLNNTPDLTLDIGTGATDAGYKYGQDIINDVSVTYYPKQTEVGAILYANTYRIKMAAKSTKVKYFKATLPEGAKLTIVSINQMNATSSPSTLTAESFSGRDITAYVSMHLEVFNNLIKAQITNSSGENGYVYVTIRGTSILSYGSEVTEVADDTSIIEHGLKPMKSGINLRAISNVDMADNLASFYIEKYKTSRGAVLYATLKSRDDTWTSRMLTYGIGALLSLTEPQLGITSQKYIVIGEKFQYTPGILQGTWELDVPNFPVDGWILGTSTLGTDTYLRY